MARDEKSSEVLREFGRRVREARTRAGWSLEGLAERADLHWTYIGQIERGQRNLSLINIVKVAGGLGVDAGELLQDLGTPVTVEVTTEQHRRQRAPRG